MYGYISARFKLKNIREETKGIFHREHTDLIYTIGLKMKWVFGMYIYMLYKHVFITRMLVNSTK